MSSLSNPRSLPPLAIETHPSTTMSGSTRKGSLPIEVLDLVFSHLPMPLDVYDLRIEYADADPLYGEEGEESRPLPQRNRWAHRDLLACALVSRSFSQAALPLLWKVIAAGEGFLLGDAALRTLTSMQSQSQREFYCSCVESLQLCLPHLIELQGSRTLEHLVRLRNVTFGKAQTNYTKRAELATPIDYSGLLNGRLLSLSISDTLVMKQVVHSGIFFEQLDILQIEIERDTVSEQDVEAFASFLAPCTELEEIVLWTSSMQYINPAVIKHIFSCGNLKYLSLNAHLDEEILDPILRSGSQKFVNLERAWICLPACYLPRVLSGSRSLRSLVINIIPGPALREGDALEGCERLETITIDHDPPTPSCCDYLRVFAECTNLRKLRVRDAANSAQPAISTVKLCSQIFSKLGRLEALECHRFEDAAMSILGHSCPMLTDLKTGFNGVSLPIIGAEVCFPMLKWLQVSTDEVENFSSIFCASYSASSEISWVRDRMFQRYGPAKSTPSHLRPPACAH